MSMIDTTLPPYSTRISTRAKHVRLSIKPGIGLEIIVPKRIKKIDFAALISRNRLWIDEHLIKIAKRSKPAFANLPDQISLLAAEKTWHVHYQVLSTKRIVFTEIDDKQLLLTGNIEDKSACRKVLCQWLIEQAKLTLLPWLADLTNLHQLAYKKATIRQQKTRWGSCSKEKCINLNANLLFLPKNLAEHIILHELCHTIHLNHSAKFWSLLTTFDTDCQQHRQTIKQAGKYVPDWLEAPHLC